MAFLTSRTQITAVTANDLVHIVVTGDTSQGNMDGSSYKSTIGQIFDSLSGYCVDDFYVKRVHSCGTLPLYIQPVSTGDTYMVMGGGDVGINTTNPSAKLHVSGNTWSENTVDTDTLILSRNLYTTTAATTQVRAVLGGQVVAQEGVGYRLLSGIFAVSGYKTEVTGFDDGGTGYLKNALTITVAGPQPRGSVNIGVRDNNTFLRFFSGLSGLGDFNSTTLRGSLNSSGYWGFGQNMTTQTSTVDISGSTGYNQLRLRQSYTPINSADSNGQVGDTAWSDDYFYIKTSTGWKRAGLSSF